ncbi:Copia protein [Araneus ventricosus]|uniref:Copia protein n=1 Tax=Araneus ventricosus TaxID=182803 RepID=A0A4Y2DVJ3_ARAVE|nr:Copia protein [Araneus ventricosus]
MKAILDEHDVKECIFKPPSETEDNQRPKKNKKCKLLIIQCIADSHLEYIKDKQTAWEICNSLIGAFERKGIAIQLYLRMKFLMMKKEDEDCLEVHFVKFDENVRHLKSASAKLEEGDIVCHLLLTLPSSYENVITGLETLTSEKLTLEFVKGRLLDGEMKRANRNDVSQNAKNNISAAFESNKSSSKLKFKLKCYHCWRIGHEKSECRLLKNKPKQVANVKMEGNER